VGKDQDIQIGHVIARNDYAAGRRNILGALPIPAHKEIEDWDDEI
jgi:hypothetical protein